MLLLIFSREILMKLPVELKMRVDQSITQTFAWDPLWQVPAFLGRLRRAFGGVAEYERNTDLDSLRPHKPRISKLQHKPEQPAAEPLHQHLPLPPLDSTPHKELLLLTLCHSLVIYFNKSR